MPLLDVHIKTSQRNPESGALEASDYRGGLSDAILDNNFVGLHRPYFDRNGDRAVTVNVGRTTNERGERVPIREHVLVNDLGDYGMASPVANATALRKEEWLELDRQVLKAARYRLRAYADLAAANSFGGFNGMAKLILEHETMSDPGEAMVDMDGLTEGRNDSPQFQLEGLPLPITHADFWVSARKLAVSRNTGTPLDMTMGEANGRRVAERIEKVTIGNVTGTVYGGASTYVGGYGRTAQVYGYTNFTPRLTKTNFTAPTAAGWKPESTQQEFNAALLQLRNQKFYGPFMVYHSNDWDTYLDGDYYALATSGMAAPSQTLRQRLKQIDGVVDVRRLDMLFSAVPQTQTIWTTSNVGTTGILPYTGPGGEDVVSANAFTLIFVQMTPDVARAVNGQSITTVQWESQGGMRLNFKTLCIEVAQLRADYYGNCGILHGTTA